MQIFLGVITGLIVLVILVVLHELGHAIIARRNGVGVEEFGIGFPPRAYKRKLKNGVLFTLNWLPLGGFVRMQGEHDAADQPGDYGAASFWAKTRILLAGVIVNWLIAAVLLSILALVGLPQILSNQFTVASDRTLQASPVEIASISNTSPASKAGLKVGDAIVRFAGEKVITPEDLVKETAANKGKKVEIVYDRRGDEHSTMVTLRSNDDNGQGYLGVGPGQTETIRSTWSAPIVGVVTTAQFTAVTFQGLGQLVSNLAQGIVLQFNPSHSAKQQAHADLQAVSGSVAGPVGILGTIFPAAEQAGPAQLVLLSAIISLTLSVMNVLPIPALDGGRWFVMALFKVCRWRLTKKREETIQSIGFVVLMLLVIVVSIGDVSKLV